MVSRLLLCVTIYPCQLRMIIKYMWIAAASAASVPSDVAQYERTLSKRHPNRGSDVLRAMADDHLAESSHMSRKRLDELAAEFPTKFYMHGGTSRSSSRESHKEVDVAKATYADMARSLLLREGYRDKPNDEIATEFISMLTGAGRQIPNRRALWSCIARERRMISTTTGNDWRAPRAYRGIPLGHKNPDLHRMSGRGMARWLLMQGENRTKTNMELVPELADMLERGGKGNMSREYVSIMLSKARRELSTQTGDDYGVYKTKRT